MSGTELKSQLNLNNYDFVYIQRVMNPNKPVYIISYNSRNPSIPISLRKLNKTRTFQVFTPSSNKIKKSKLSNSWNIDYYIHDIPDNSVIIMRDLIGEYVVS